MELFIFTDNIVFEEIYYKADSSSPKLHELMLRLYLAEMKGKLIIHMIHIAGTRMKECGMDGMSRGIFLKGMMAGGDLLSYLPLAKGALEVSPGLEMWIRSWWEGSPLVKLDPKGWFTRGHRNEGYLCFDKGIAYWSRAILKDSLTYCKRLCNVVAVLTLVINDIISI